VSDLGQVMDQLGVEIKRQTGDELNGRCPVHHLYKGRSSGGFSFYINVDSGLWQCFTCGARGNLPSLVTALTNDPHAIKGVHLFLAQSGLESRRAGPEEEEEASADWQVYAGFGRVPAMLLESRGLDGDQAFRFGVRYNLSNRSMPDGTDRPDYRCWIVPVLDSVGRLMGWQAKQDGYFANVPTGIHKSKSLFGLMFARGDSALLLESPLDVVRFHSVYKGSEIQAVASYGASVSEFQIGMLRSRFDRLIMALDNDTAGKLESSRLYGLQKDSINSLTGYRKRVWWWDYSGTDAKDIGDMSDDQILAGLSNITRTPPDDLPRYRRGRLGHR